MKTKTPLPSWAVNAPSLFMGLEFSFGAFFKLCGDRPTGMGLAPIPFASIYNYGKLFGLESDNLDDFVEHVRAMDLEYLAFENERRELEKSQDSS